MALDTTLQIQHLIVRFRGFTLGPINAEIQPGITIVMGPNGAGKTTLMRTIAGLLAPDNGRIALMVEGRERKVKNQVAYMPQDISFEEAIEASTLLNYYARLLALDRSRLRELVDYFNLKPYLRSRVYELSGGLKKRLALVLTLAQEKPVILLDEPFTGLDNETILLLVREITRLSGERIVVMASHTHELLYTILEPQNILVLHQGKQLFHGPPQLLTEKARKCTYYTMEPGKKPSPRNNCIEYSICGLPRLACLEEHSRREDGLKPINYHETTIHDKYNCLLLITQQQH